MGMWPTATLTYGYDVKLPDADWADDDEPEEAAGQLITDAGLPEHIGINRDYEGCHYRLIASFMQASGWNDRKSANSLKIPNGAVMDMRRAAEILGIDLGDAKPVWMLTGEFS